MTKNQESKIKRNLDAFTANFGEPRIEKYPHDPGFYVFYPADSDTWIQRCENVDYLNGWLYGCVQGVLRKEFKK